MMYRQANLDLSPRSRSLRSACIALTLLPWGQIGIADEAADELSEELFFSDVPIVLSATRLRQPITEVPAAMTVIGRELIEASGAIDIADLFRLVPGFQVGYASGSKPTIGYHGNTDNYSRNMQVLVDGRSIYDPGFGGVTWLDQELDIDDIQRIEVIRGPNAASYGSNSYAGVINIITIHPSEQQGSRFKTIVGKFAHRQVSVKHAGTLGDLAYRLTAQYDQDDGFQSRISDSSDTRWINFRGDYQVDTNNALLIELGMSDGDRGEGFAGDQVQPPRTAEDRHNFQQLRWTSDLGKNGEFSLQAYHNYQRIDDHFVDQIGDPGVPIPPGFLQMGYGFRSHRFDIEFQHSMRLSEDQRLVWGLGARQDRTAGFWVFGNDEWLTRNQARGFGNLEWQLSKKFILNVGGMYEKFEDKSGFLSPRIALNFKATENHIFRIVSNTAYRMPTLWEDFGGQAAYTAAGRALAVQIYSASENVEPEKNQTLEFGLMFNFPKYDFQMDVKTFEETYSNLISEVKNKAADVFYYTNDGTYTSRGWEVGFDWKPTPNSMLHIAYNRSHDKGWQMKKFPVTVANDTRNMAGGIPEQTISILGSYTFRNGIQLTGAFYYMDEMGWTGDGDNVPNAYRSDIHITKKFRSGGINGKLGLLLQRYSDDYTDFYKDNGHTNLWQDRAFLNLTLNWN